MITLSKKLTKESQRKLWIYSIIISLCWVIIEFIRVNYFDKVIGFEMIEVKYSTARLFYYLFVTLVTAIGCSLLFITEKRKIIYKLIIFISILVIIRILISDYIWNVSLNNTSERHYLINFLLWISHPFYITSFIYAFHYKKNKLIAFISIYLLQNLILSAIGYFSWVAFYPFSKNSILFVATITWPLFWFILYYITEKYQTIKDFIFDLKHLLSIKSNLNLKEYRKVYILINSPLLLITIATYNLYQFSHTILFTNWLLLSEIFLFTLTILVLTIFSFTTLYQRLSYLNLKKYLWYRLIPLLNIYLIYITLFNDNKERDNYVA